MTMRPDQLVVCKMAAAVIREASDLVVAAGENRGGKFSISNSEIVRKMRKLVNSIGVVLPQLEDLCHNAEHLLKCKGVHPERQELFPDSKMTGNSL